MTEIYLIRHAQASFGTADYDRLSNLGHRQAALLGGYFRQAGIGFDAVFAGPLRRHAQTAGGALSAPETVRSLQIVSELDEIDTEGILAARIATLLDAEPDLAAAYEGRHNDPRAYRQVVSRAMHASLPEAGSSSDAVGHFVARVRAGLRRVAARSQGCRRVAVFTSGGTIAVTLQTALSLAPAVAVEIGWQIYNTSVSVFEAQDGGLSLVAFNTTAHLDLETDTDLKTLF